MTSDTQLHQHFAQLIDGQLETGNQLFSVTNPATGKPFVECPRASIDQLNQAVVAARRAFPTWSKKSIAERRDCISRFADLMQDNLEKLAAMLTLEQGKPIASARAEISIAIGTIRQLIRLVVEPEILRDDASGRFEIYYKPLGVVGAITPWNVPIILAAQKTASALYTGNTIVVKPSPYTPLTTLMLGEIARDVFPPGVLNIIAGGNDLGQWMSEHPGIDMITFTGSIATGKKVMMSAASNMKRLTLELGGNDAAIVLDDVDPSEIADKIFKAAFANSGQVCQAIKRLYVHEDVYETLLDELVKIARNVKVGDGMDDGVELGPVQNKVQYQHVLAILEDAARQPGVRILAGGHSMNRPGFFIEPTIVADIMEGTRLVDEEPFGPVLPVLRFSDVEDAIRRANATRFGLAGSVWTNNIQKGAAVARQLEAGVVWVNHHLGISAEYPFGGVKESGVGRANGVLGLKGYMEAHLIVTPATGAMKTNA